jgi:class 3 adenylate cyclase
MTSIPVHARPLAADGQVHTLLATDIVGYSSACRDHEIRRYLRDSLYMMLRDALTGSGIPWEGCHLFDQGDGVLVVVSPDIPAEGLIDPFPVRLRTLIRRHNHVSSDAARMQLRATLHAGPVYSDAHGLVSDDITFLFRMLDARRLRKAVADPGTELAVAVSRYVYESMVLRHPSLADAAQFTPFTAGVKRTSVRGWLYLPGHG